MNSNEPERDSIAAQWLRAWLVLVLPTFLLGLLFFGLSQSTQAKPTKQQGENLVLNPGFELPDPAFWYNSGSHQWKWEYFWSDSTFHGGSHSVGMLSNVEKRFEGWWWSAPFVVEAGRQYSFSGWIRASELSGNALLTLAFYSSESLGDQIQEFPSSYVDGSVEWTEVTGGAVAPEGAHYGRIFCRLRGRGTAWFDDIFAGQTHTETPILDVSKADYPDPVQPGEDLVYTITYSNTGAITATQVVITETYDVHVDFEDADPDADSNDRVWEIGTLGPQVSDTIVITVRVHSPLADGLILENKVEMDCHETEPVSFTATTQIASSPDLLVSKSDKLDPVKPGGTLAYTITYDNIGTAVCTGVDITDTLPLSVSYDSASIAPTITFSETNTLVWKDLDDVNVGAGGWITVTTTATSAIRGGASLHNHVWVSCDEGVQVEAQEETLILPDSLRMVPDGDIGAAPPGQEICFNHVVYLTGTESHTVSVTGISSQGWMTSTDPTMMYLDVGVPKLITACVDVPAGCDTTSGTVDVLTVTARLIGNPGGKATARDITVVDPVLLEIPVIPAYSSVANCPDGYPRGFSFPHRIINTGNYTAEFGLEIIDDCCIGECPPTKVRVVPISQTVEACQSFTATVYITVTSVDETCWAGTRVAPRYASQPYTEFFDEVGTPRTVYLPLIVKDVYVSCNTGFETGDFQCWEHGGELARSVQCDIVHEGDCAALLGNPAYPCRNVPVGAAWISQDFHVPSNCSPRLSFCSRILTQDHVIWTDGETLGDSFDVYVQGNLVWRDGYGNYPDPSPGCDSLQDLGWRCSSVDLSAYKGQNVQVSFYNANRVDHYYNTWTYVDFVAVGCETQASQSEDDQ